MRMINEAMVQKSVKVAKCDQSCGGVGLTHWFTLYAVAAVH